MLPCKNPPWGVCCPGFVLRGVCAVGVCACIHGHAVGVEGAWAISPTRGCGGRDRDDMTANRSSIPQVVVLMPLALKGHRDIFAGILPVVFLE